MATTQACRGSHAVTALNRAQHVLRGAALLLSLGLVGLPAVGEEFKATGSLSAQRTFHTSTMLPDGKVLVAGGQSPGVGFLSTAEVYDPARGTFVPTGGMLEARYLHTGTLLGNGKVLIAGGFNSTSMSLIGAELYDPATGSFTSAGRMTVARYAHTATTLADGRVLIAGGFSINGTTALLDVAELYDPATGVFAAVGRMTTPRFRHTATMLADGRVLLAGGFGPAGNLDSAELFDPSTNTFAATGGMSVPRYIATGTRLPNGKVLVVGGMNGGTIHSSAEIYDPALGSFSIAGTMGESRYDHSATPLPDGQVLIAGGRNPASGNLTSAELYDPVSQRFSPAASMGTQRYGHSASRLKNGRVLVAGGASSVMAELYGSAIPPIADAGPDQNIYLGQSATLSGAASSDPGGAALAYTWTLESRPAGSNAALSAAAGVSTGLYPDAVGQYVVSLVVDNGTDTSTADTVFVNVDRNLPPVAAATGAPVSGEAPLVVLFDGGASSDPENGPLTYSWNFGDGTPADASVNPNHMYTVPGTYSAVLTVTDNFGNTDQAPVAITVTAPNTPPTVGPTASPASGAAPLTVQLNAHAADREGNPLSYAWNFGDGSAGSALPTPSHTYSAPGVYTANVVVSDGMYLVNRAVTISVGSALAGNVTQAKVKFGKPGKADDKIELEAKFTYPGTPSGTIRIVFDGVTLLDVPFSSFERERRGRYEYRGRNVHAKLDLVRGTLKVSRHRMLLTGVDNSNGIDVLIAFGSAVSTEHLVMHEHKHHGERTLHYRKKHGKKHTDSHRWWQRWHRN